MKTFSESEKDVYEKNLDAFYKMKIVHHGTVDNFQIEIKNTFKVKLGTFMEDVMEGLSIKTHSTLEEQKMPSFSEGSETHFGANLLGSYKDGMFVEKWDKTIMISARVSKILDDVVHCECILSKEYEKVELRSFPKLLMSNINPLKVGAPLKIKISVKAGSTRTDIIDGKGLGIEDEFKLLDEWDELSNYTPKPAY